MNPRCLLTGFVIHAAVHIFLCAGTAIQWDKTFGGEQLRAFNIVRQTSDGGYISGGCRKVRERKQSEPNWGCIQQHT